MNEPSPPVASSPSGARRLWQRVRPLLRDAAAGALFAAGVTRPQRRCGGRLSIATFHRVLPDELRREYPLPGLAVTPEELDGLLDFVTRHYTVGPLGEIFARWRRGEIPPRPWLAATFDDTPWDNVSFARPVLERHGVRATFFAPAGLVERAEFLPHDRLVFAAVAAARSLGTAAVAQSLGEPLVRSASLFGAARAVVEAAKRLDTGALDAFMRRVEDLAAGAAPPAWARLMSWADLAALAAEGHEIGSHSMDHRLLPRCTDAEIDREVVESRALLERRLQRRITTFCYPNGSWDARALAAVCRAGYECAVTTRDGLNGRDADPHRLDRVDLQARHFARTGSAIHAGRAAWRLCAWSHRRPPVEG